MKFRDYVRISRISLKSKKKTTRATVRGISFGLILLLPLLFLVMAFYIDLNEEVNKESGIRIFDVPVIENKYANNYPDSILESDKEKILSLEGVINTVEYNQYNLFAFSNENFEDINPNLFITIDGYTIPLENKIEAERDEFIPYFGLTVINQDKSNDIFLKSDYDILNGKSPLVSGSIFSDNSKEEIMLSSDFVNLYNLGNEIVGKTITLSQMLAFTDSVTNNKSESHSDIFDSYTGLEINILKNFKVVGIFDSAIYNTSIRYKSEVFESIGRKGYGTHFWITNESVNNNYLPEAFVPDDLSSRLSYYYDNNPVNLAKMAIDSGYAFLPFGLGVMCDNYSGIKESKLLIEFDTYSNANNAVPTINSAIIDSSSIVGDNVILQETYVVNTFASYRLFYNIFTYVCIILAVFGGIIFLATLLNLYNTIHYAVQSKKNYIGMMRAIGMKNKEVIRLYFMEILVIFMRAYIWTAIFGGLICGGIYFVFDMVMDSEYAKMLLIDLSLNPIYILISFGILVVVNLIISLIFSGIATHKVSRSPILQVLDDKN